jgi:phosphatidylglycerophosphatase A
MYRPTVRFMLSHPAHLLALGFGSGLSPKAPGTVGTLWAWLSFLVLDVALDELQWMLLLALALPVGWWACTRTAQHMAVADPGSIVWDEIIAFWAVLLLVTPAGAQLDAGWSVVSQQMLLPQAVAFGLFRFFDAAKPGPVAWADRLFKRSARPGIGWGQGFGILFDDLIAALCALLVVALWQRLW